MPLFLHFLFHPHWLVVTITRKCKLDMLLSPAKSWKGHCYDDTILAYCSCPYLDLAFKWDAVFTKILFLICIYFFLKLNNYISSPSHKITHFSHEGHLVWHLVSLDLHIWCSKNTVPLCFYCKCYYFNFSKTQTVYLNPGAEDCTS